MNNTLHDEEPLEADECTSMAEVRQGVDCLDRQLVTLLEKRFAYMRAAARIKVQRGQVRDEERKAAVIAAAVEQSRNAGLPAEQIAVIWDHLVEASIAYEMVEWDRLRSS